MAIGTVMLLVLVALIPRLLMVTKELSVFVGQILLDDALYYLIPAFHFIHGQGSTFDGINFTNGYHPLWFLVCCIISAIKDPIIRIQMVSLLSGVLYVLGAAVIAFGIYGKSSLWARLFLFSLFVFNFKILLVFLSGLENGITFFLLACTMFWGTLKESRRGKFYYLFYGVLLSFLALARVDTIIFGGLMVLRELWLKRNKIEVQGWKFTDPNVGMMIVPMIIIFGGYLLSNLLIFHTLSPISGMVKLFYESTWLSSGYPNGGFWTNILWHFQYVLELAIGDYAKMADSLLYGLCGTHTIPLSLLISGCSACSLIGLSVLIANGIKELSPLFMLVVFSIIHLTIYAVTLPHFTAYGTWYFTFEYCALMIGLFSAQGWIVGNFLKLLKKYHGSLWQEIGTGSISIIICAAMAMLTIQSSRNFGQKTQQDNRYYGGALWINQNLPKHVVIGSMSSGFLSYFTKDRTVVNLDGLINSKEYYGYLQRGRFDEYVRTHLDYFADYSTDDLEKLGICWVGSCIEPKHLTLVRKFQINKSEAYYIFRVEKESSLPTLLSR